jgi:hypothetical protein
MEETASMLRDMDDKGGIRELRDIDYRSQFDRKWLEFTPEEQQAIDEEIERLLDALRDSPDPLWGSIMNTSIEGGKANPFNGLRGDWTGTPCIRFGNVMDGATLRRRSSSARFGNYASSSVRNSGLEFEARTSAPRSPIATSTFRERRTSWRPSDSSLNRPSYMY